MEVMEQTFEVVIDRIRTGSTVYLRRAGEPVEVKASAVWQGEPVIIDTSRMEYMPMEVYDTECAGSLAIRQDRPSMRWIPSLMRMYPLPEQMSFAELFALVRRLADGEAVAFALRGGVLVEVHPNARVAVRRAAERYYARYIAKE